MIKQAIAKVVKQEDLTEKEMGGVMEEIMSGWATPAQVKVDPIVKTDLRKS